jgi:hypothetical protein
MGVAEFLVGHKHFSGFVSNMLSRSRKNFMKLTHCYLRYVGVIMLLFLDGHLYLIVVQ